MLLKTHQRFEVNPMEILQIFLIAALLFIPFVIRNKSCEKEDTETKPIQVALPTAIFVMSILIMNKIEVIKNPFIKVIVALSVYFVAFYIIKNLIK